MYGTVTDDAYDADIWSRPTELLDLVIALTQRKPQVKFKSRYITMLCGILIYNICDMICYIYVRGGMIFKSDTGS